MRLVYESFSFSFKPATFKVSVTSPSKWRVGDKIMNNGDMIGTLSDHEVAQQGKGVRYNDSSAYWLSKC